MSYNTGKFFEKCQDTEEKQVTAPQTEPASDIDDLLNSIFGESESGKEEVQEERKPSFLDEEEEEKEKVDNSFAEMMENFRDLGKTLMKKVIGQQHAVLAFCESYMRKNLVCEEKSKEEPLFMLFIGPAHSGKYMLAKTASEKLGKACVKISAEEYGNNVDAFFEKIAMATKISPDAFLYVDGVDNCSDAIANALHRIINERSEKEKFGLDGSVVIISTEAGTTLYERKTLFTDPDQATVKEALRDIGAQKVFPSVLLSDLSALTPVIFGRLSHFALHSIAERTLKTLSEGFHKRYGVEVLWEDLLPFLLYTINDYSEADKVISATEKFFKTQVLALFNIAEDKKINNLSKVKFSLNLDGCHDTVKSMLSSDAKVRFMVYADDKRKDIFAPFKNIEAIFVNQPKDAMRCLAENNVDAVVVDLMCGVAEKGRCWENPEDIDSVGRDLISFMKDEYSDVPTLLLETCELAINEKTLPAFAKAGIDGKLTAKGDAEVLERELKDFCTSIKLKRNCEWLEQSGYAFTYNTAQKFSPKGTRAEITVYGIVPEKGQTFRMEEYSAYDICRTDRTFNNLAGMGRLKGRFAGVIEYLRAPRKVRGARIPNTFMFIGPAGCGKTSFVEAIAGEAGVPLVRCSGKRLVTNYAEKGESAIVDMFKAAEKCAPSILFIDEICDICCVDSSNKVLNEAEMLLTRLIQSFRFDPLHPVIIMSAANDTRKLSYSTVGHLFGAPIYIPGLSQEERMLLIKVILKNVSKNLKENVSDSFIKNMAARVIGMPPGFVIDVLKASARKAEESGEITETIIDETLEEFCYGDKTDISEDSIKRTAYHESGHALVHWKSGIMPSYLTVTPRGSFLGYMMKGNLESVKTQTKEDFLWNIRCSLAGRASEVVFFGDEGINTGASADLQSANVTARLMICLYGMGRTPACLLEGHESFADISEDARKEIAELLAREYEKTIMIIKENKALIQKLVDALMEDNSLTQQQLIEILEPERASEMKEEEEKTSEDSFENFISSILDNSQEKEKTEEKEEEGSPFVDEIINSVFPEDKKEEEKETSKEEKAEEKEEESPEEKKEESESIDDLLNDIFGENKEETSSEEKTEKTPTEETPTEEIPEEKKEIASDKSDDSFDVDDLLGEIFGGEEKAEDKKVEVVEEAPKPKKKRSPRKGAPPQKRSRK